MIKQILKVAVAIVVLSAAKPAASEGPFLTFELGTLVNGYGADDCIPSGDSSVSFRIDPSVQVNSGVVIDKVTIGCTGEKYIGDSGWIGNLRAGWSSKDYRIWRKLHMSAHGVFQHTSDPKISDGGMEFVGFGVTFKGKKR